MAVNWLGNTVKYTAAARGENAMTVSRMDDLLISGFVMGQWFRWILWQLFEEKAAICAWFADTLLQVRPSASRRRRRECRAGDQATLTGADGALVKLWATSEMLKTSTKKRCVTWRIRRLRGFDLNLEWINHGAAATVRDLQQKMELFSRLEQIASPPVI
jgi:hypothetical protein